jgi:hypothetical protein
MGAVAVDKARAAMFRRALKIDRLLTEFAGLLSALDADDLIADVAAMRAKNAQRMTDQGQHAAYEEMRTR